MKYIVCRTFKGRGLGGEFDLKRGSSCEEIRGIITHNQEAICINSSQNAFDFFARNDDKKGYERFALVHEILDKIKEFVAEYNDEFMAIRNSDVNEEKKAEMLSSLPNRSVLAYEAIRKAFPNFLRDNNDVFSFDFYNAEVEELAQVKDIVEGC